MRVNSMPDSANPLAMAPTQQQTRAPCRLDRRFRPSLEGTLTKRTKYKDHPATGSSPFGDTLAITRVDKNTIRIVSKLAGKQTIVQTIVVAADGKTRTTTAKGTDGKGQPVDSMSFYEKQ